MASICSLFLPNGHNFKVFYNKETDRNKLMTELMEMWVPYCEENWLSNNHEDIYCPERKVKKFLDSTAYFILYGNVEDTITLYKAKRNREREVPLVVISNTGELCYEERDRDESRPRKQKTITRRQRIDAIKAANPGIKLTEALVDVNGNFMVNGARYFIDHTVDEYRPILVKGEEFFPFDKVIVGQTKNGLRFYSQGLTPLDGKIHKYETKVA